MPAAIPGHNAVLVLFGAGLALVGWLGLNSAGAVLFAAIEPAGVVLIAINTTLAAASAAITVVLVTRLRFGRPDASLAANGWVGGLAASSAACAFVAPASAVVIGSVAGMLAVFAVELLELRWMIDDPAGAIATHGVAGIWGVLAFGIFPQVPARALSGGNGQGLGTGGSGQFLAQLIGVATLLGFVLPLTYLLNWLLNRIHPLRVAPEAEERGLDLHELGAEAYPEFVVHTEDFGQHGN
jgi:Amt family ammonium transporter